MLLSATTSRKKQQAEAVQSVIHAEAEKRRKERENFHITSVPVLVRAAHEPSLYNGSSEDHEEGSVRPKQGFAIYLEPKPRSNFSIGIRAEFFSQTETFFFFFQNVFLLLKGQ